SRITTESNSVASEPPIRAASCPWKKVCPQANADLSMVRPNNFITECKRAGIGNSVITECFTTTSVSQPVGVHAQSPAPIVLSPSHPCG
ncbi:MAG: hypothetical protein ACI9OD_003092, partial [Limisphaerales bacterium]